MIDLVLWLVLFPITVDVGDYIRWKITGKQPNEDSDSKITGFYFVVALVLLLTNIF